MPNTLHLSTLFASALALATPGLADTQERAGDITQQAADALQAGAAATADTAGQIAQLAQDAADGAAEGAEGVLDGAAEGIDGALDGAAEQADGALDATGDAARTAYSNAEAWWEARADAPATAEGFQRVDLINVAAEKIAGARAYDGEDAWIGEVSQVLMSDDRVITALHVDVGGILGFGEHRVEVGTDQFIVTEHPETAVVRIHLMQTREMLEAQPEVEG